MSSVRPPCDWPKGRVVRFQHRSEVLAGNPWDDPLEREVAVYLPHAYSEDGPPSIALWDLAAFTNTGPGHLNWRNHGENLPDRIDRLIGTGQMEPAVIVFPDCYTSLGGNQYLNSPAVGRYADYLVTELVPFLEARLNLVGSRSGRGLFGKSSGGYGALFHAMHHADVWGAVASHSGDVGFDLVYRSEFPKACAILAACDGDPHAFLRAFWRLNQPSGRDYSTLLIVAMAASYDPDPGDPSRIRLPFDVRTCAIHPDRWQRWMEFDPLNMVDQHLEALRSLHGLYIDVGTHDQYHIQYGTRRLADLLKERGVRHRFEEFEGTHSAIDWRLDHSLPHLASALKMASAASI